MSEFIEAALTDDAFTWNGAISNSTTSSACLDYFAKAGTYRARPQEAVDVSMAAIFSENPAVALRLIFGLRLISRKVKIDGAEKYDESQTGFGQRDEFFKVINWLMRSRPNIVAKNLALIPVFGCWKDIFEMDFLPTKQVYQLILENIHDPLLLKYLPTWRGSGRMNTEKRGEKYKKKRNFAMGLCDFAGISRIQYQKMKREGMAHLWQRQMSQNKWGEINFNTIPGKAMFNHITKKGEDEKTVFERHNQIERLKTWVEAQPTIKFTGYPYELLKAARNTPNIIQRLVLDRQFLQVMEQMKDHQLGNVLAALDTSGSMSFEAVGGTSALDICMSMGIAFSSMNVGYFKDVVAMFASTSKLLKLKGGFCDKVSQIPKNAMGCTNFQSLINLIVKVRKENPNVSIDEFPETLLVVSDMQFNPVGGNTATNYKVAMQKLKEVGLGEIRIIWWCVNGAGVDFPAKMNDRGVYIIGGFDPVNLKALMGKKLNANETHNEKQEKKEQTPLDGLNNFLSQPVFDLIATN